MAGKNKFSKQASKETNTNNLKLIQTMPQDNPSVGRRVSRSIAKTLCPRSINRLCAGSAVALFFLLTVILSGVFSGLSRPHAAYAQTPNTTLNFQARILNSSGSLVPDGDYHFEFKIYDTVSSGGTAQGACSGNCLWMETRTGGNVVRVVNGYVSVSLGSVTAFPSNIPWGNNLYATMRVGGNSGSPSWDTEMTNSGNRMKLSVVPVAFVANNVASGATSSASTNSNSVTIQSGNASGATSNSGNITIDTGTATGTTGTVTLGASNASALTLGRSGLTTTNAGALTVTETTTLNGNLQVGNAITDNITISSAIQGANALIFDGATDNTNEITLAVTDPGADFTITLPAETGIICTTGSVCSGYAASSTAFIQNGNSFTANAVLGTNDSFSLILETANVAALTVDTSQNATFAGNLSVSAGKYISLAGGNTASRPGSPTEGMVYFDTTTKQLLTYANGKWQADRSTATKIVAANNSSQALKDSADYVADGTADEVEINAALTAATGGKVYLAEGTYIAATTILIPNNTTLVGSGHGSVIELADLDANENLIENTDTTTGTGVVIRDITLNGRKDLNTSGTQFGIRFNGMGAGSGASARNGGQIINVLAKSFRTIGIQIISSYNNTVSQNVVRDSTTGISLDSALYNTITSNTTQGNSTAGIYISNASNSNNITGNTDQGATTYGIAISASANNNVSSNTIVGATGYGVHLSSSANYNTVSSNNILGSGEGVYVNSSSNNTVSSNNLEGNGYGIHLLVSSHNNTVTGNAVTGGTYGIYVNSTASSYNTITGNTVQNVTAGVYLSNATYSTVSGNTVRTASSWGVILSSATAINVSNNQIYDTGGATTSNGIYLTDTDNSSISGNFITDIACTTNCYAINVFDSTSDNNYLENNTYRTTSSDHAVINDAGTGTRYASQLTPATVLQSGSSLIRANASSALTGTADPDGDTTPPGTGTKFTTELQVGDRITINAETRTVTVITNDTTITVDTAFTNTASAAITRLPAALRVANSSGVNQLLVQDNGNIQATGQLLITGTNADQSQLVVRANSSQTLANPLVLLQNSSGSELARINASTTSLYFGNAAGGSNASGANNTAVGASALGAVSTGAANTTLGSGALASITGNSNSTAVGYNAGNLSTGGNNIFLGYQAGDNVVGGTNNIIIGYDLNASAAGVNNELRIGGVLQGDTSTLAAQFNGALTVTGLTTLNGGLTVEAGDTFTFNGDAFTDLTGSGLTVSSNALTVDATSATGFFRNGGNSFGAAGTIGTNDAYALQFETGGTTRGNFDTSGNFTIGTTAAAAKLDINGTETTNLYSANIRQTLQSSSGGLTGLRVATTFDPTGAIATAIFGINTNVTVGGSSANGITNLSANRVGFTLGSSYTGTVSTYSGIYVADLSNSGSGVVTNQYGINVQDLTGGASANRGIVSQVSSGAGKFNLYVSGTADNAFAGNVRIGSTTAPTVALDVTGAGTFSGLLTGNLGATISGATTSINASSNFATNINTGTSTGAVTIGNTSNANNSVTLAAGSSGFVNFDVTQAQFREVTGTRTLTVQTRTSAGVAGSNLTVQAGAASSAAGAASVGGVLTLQGGTANGTSGAANGGNVVIAGGTGYSTGVKGLVVIDTATYSAASVQNFTANANITQANIDTYGSLLISGNVAGWVATLTDPTQSTTGRVIYVTNSGSVDITLGANAVGVALSITLKPGSTATMYWNGVDWTAAGASSSTDLQAAYDNTATSAGGAEIVLSSTGTGGLTIRNDDTAAITGGLLEVQTSIGSNLFTVNNNATEYANNGGSESSTYTMWAAAPAGGSVSRYTTAGNNIATGAASTFSDNTSTANTGIKNTLTTTLTANLKYKVSYTVRTVTTTAFTTLDTIYSSDGTATTATCASASTATYSTWTRVDCSFIATAVGASNAIIIRHSDAVEHDFYIDNLSVTVSADVNHAADGSVDSALGTNWTDFGANTAGTTAAVRNTTVLYDTSGSVEKTTGATADRGVINNLGITPSVSTQYLVTLYARSSNSFNDIRIRYSRDGGTDFESCVDYNTQTVSTSAYTKITCVFTTDGSAASNPDLVIDQPTATARTFYIDALSVTLNTNNSSNVQVGGANKGGPTTLFTLDRSNGAPIAANNDAYLGSMYYDTSTGRIQCYEADGWGACGAAPDNIVNLNPEYAGAVLNGTGVGTMTADFCAEQAGVLNVNTTLCDTGQAKNYYKWTSPQATQQTYSIYVTYQLPATFNGFSSDDTVQLVARTDNTTNAAVTYEMYKSTGSAVTQCGSGETTVVTTVDTWQSVGINGNESTGCSFTSSSASNFIIFKINVKANSNANAYVSTLSFTTTGR